MAFFMNISRGGAITVVKNQNGDIKLKDERQLNEKFRNSYRKFRNQQLRRPDEFEEDEGDSEPSNGLRLLDETRKLGKHYAKDHMDVVAGKKKYSGVRQADVTSG